MSRNSYSEMMSFDGSTSCYNTRSRQNIQVALEHLRQKTRRFSIQWLEPPFSHNRERARMEAEVFNGMSEHETLSLQTLLFILKISFMEGQGFIYRLRPSDTAHQCNLRNDDEILLINGMTVTGRDPICVSQILRFLARKAQSFNLMIRRESERSCIYTVKWIPSESKCIVKEHACSWDFRKDLEVISSSIVNKECYLTHVATQLCVVTDGENVRLETNHGSQNGKCVAWMYSGKENDPSSQHFQNGNQTIVFGFKLTNNNSDLTKCLGVVHNKDELILLEADIPDHGPILKTKIDCRFFYYKSFPNQCMIFESTIFERHYLAVRDVEKDNVRRPELYLKHCPSRTGIPPQDRDIIFKCEPKNKDSLQQELVNNAAIF